MNVNLPKFLVSLFLILIPFFSNAQNQHALNFDGSDDFVSSGYAGISGSSARTVEAWIRTTATTSPNSGGAQQVIADYGTMATGGRFTLNLLWSNAPRIEVGGSGLSSTSAINDGSWHHVAAVFDPNAKNKFSLYIDGQLDTAGNISTTVNTQLSNNLLIGKRIDNGKFFDGDIDEVRFWNSARTPRQIDSLYNQEICKQNGLVAYYRFNEGTASGTNTNVKTSYDKSSGNNNASLNNFGLSGSQSNWINGSTISSAPFSDTTFKDTSCGNYISPLKKIYYKSGTIKETLVNNQGCDSIITIDLIINQNSFTPIDIKACDSFVAYDGSIYKKSIIYTDVFKNISGCDSFVQNKLIVNFTQRDTVHIMACSSYTLPAGTEVFQSGLYWDSLQSIAGCDSIIWVNLTINQPSDTSLKISSCDRYISAFGNIYDQSGYYTDTIRNQTGCDSIIYLDLAINPSHDTLIKTSACDSFTTNSNQYTWYISGNYRETLTSNNGCDSVLNFELTINPSTRSSIQPMACDMYTTPSGKRIISSGIYSDVIKNSSGCDSTISIDLKIYNHTPTITQSKDTLHTENGDYTFQWLNCNPDFSIIDKESSYFYIPSKTGSYAVEVNENGCLDTTECKEITVTNSVSNLQSIAFEFYPNPASKQIYVFATQPDLYYTIEDVFGTILKEGILNQNTPISIQEIPNGCYFMRLENNLTFITKPLIIQHD